MHFEENDKENEKEKPNWSLIKWIISTQALIISCAFGLGIKLERIQNTFDKKITEVDNKHIQTNIKQSETLYNYGVSITDNKVGLDNLRQYVYERK